MKIFKYWTQEPCTLKTNEGDLAVKMWGGSNVSVEDARTKAQEKIAALLDRINSRAPRTLADYEVEIREEIIEQIDSRNIITRNRYGALILNSEDTVFVDIDQVPTPLGAALKGLFTFQFPKSLDILMEKIEKKSQELAYANVTFRLYETCKGFRLILFGRPFDPRSVETVFKDFHADPLYARLCKKQNCFRARLTPKPHRIRCKGHKVTYPRTTEEESSLQAWLATYESASSRFAVCRFVKAFGAGSGNAIIRHHDARTQATKSLKLA